MKVRLRHVDLRAVWMLPPRWLAGLGIVTLSFLCVTHVCAQAYLWSTIAGATNSGSADGTNGSALLSYPAGIAVDGAGTVYVTDRQNNTIRKLVSAGTNWVVSTIAGTAGVASNRDGTNTFALLNFPTGIAADSTGRLYVADRNNHTIRQLTPDGTNWIVTTIAGTGFGGFKDGTNTIARFNHPNGVGVGTNGTVFVADADNNLIRLITKVGTNWITQTIAGRTNVFYDTNKPPLYGPSGAVQVRSGKVYFVDQITSSLRMLAPSGPDWILGDILGTWRSGYADGTNNDALITRPGGLAVDAGENIYLADSWNNAIRKVIQSGTNWVFHTIGGTTNYALADGIGAAARFNYPNGVAVDARGNVYVADALNNAVRRGIPLPIARASTMANGTLSMSWDVAVGQALQLEYATNLGAPNWTSMGGQLTMTNSTLTITDSVSDDAQRFYRVLVIP